MSKQVQLISSPLVFISTNLGPLHMLAEDIFGDDYDPSLITLEDERYFIAFDGEVGYSFEGRVSRFALDAGPLLSEPVEIRMREDTMADERDGYYHAGPDPVLLARFKESRIAERALDALGAPYTSTASPEVSPSMAQAIAALRAIACAPADPVETEIDSALPAPQA